MKNDNFTPLNYLTIQSLLPSPFKPHLYTFSKNLHTRTLITDTPTLHIMEQIFVSKTSFLLKWRLFFYYLSICFCIWIGCKLRYLDFISHKYTQIYKTCNRTTLICYIFLLACLFLERLFFVRLFRKRLFFACHFVVVPRFDQSLILLSMVDQ